MKRLLLTLSLVLCALASVQAQTETYTVNGTNYQLQKEVSGTLTLLWNVIDQEYRYFIEKDGIISELLNTKTDGDYNEEYKQTLKDLTATAGMSADKVNLTLASLRKFVNDYNKTVDANYQDNSALVGLEYRLGAFGGITNNVFTTNPNNESTPQFGAEFEVYDPVSLPSHSFVLQYKQSLSSDEFDYSAAQFSLNYRFKFVKSDAVDFFINTKLVTLTSSKRDTPLTVTDVDGMESTIDDSGTDFQAPLLFGLGTDIKLWKGYLTLMYHDAFSFIIDDNGEFPVDISLGYKFVL